MLQRALYFLGYQYLKWTSGSTDLPVIFVVGAPRSGTTLLQDRISRHSSLFSVQAETGFFAQDNVWRRTKNWTGLRGEAIAKTKGFTLVSQFESFVAAAAELTDSQDKTFVEKTPHHVLQLGFILRSFANCKVVHIVRDPRACFASGLRHPNIKQKDAHQHTDYWLKCIVSRAKVGRSDRIFDVSYDSFVSDPEAQLDRIMSFLGLVTEPTQLSEGSSEIDPRSNLTHFEKLARPISADSLNKWKSILDPATQEVFRQRLGSYLGVFEDKEPLQTLFDAAMDPNSRN